MSLTLGERMKVTEKWVEAAGSLPFYYYHMPSMTGIAVAASDIVAEAGARIPNFRGVKFTHSDLFDMQKCLMFGNGIEVMHGYDEMLLAGLSLGAVSAVGSTYNYIPTVYHNVVS